MRYTIGSTVLNKNGDICDGIYGFNSRGLPVILSNFPDTFDLNSRIPVLDNIEDAQNYVKYLSKIYYKEFHNRAKNFNFDVSQFKFFIRKVDSSKMGGVKLTNYILPKNGSDEKFQSLKFYHFEKI